MMAALFTFWMTTTNLSEGSTTINYNHKGLRETHNGNTKDTFWFGRSCSTVLAKIRLNSLTRGTRPGCVLGQKSATFRIENSHCWIWLRSLPPPLSQRWLWMVPYQKAPVPQTRSNHLTEAGTLTIRITTIKLQQGVNSMNKIFMDKIWHNCSLCSFFTKKSEEASASAAEAVLEAALTLCFTTTKFADSILRSSLWSWKALT